MRVLVTGAAGFVGSHVTRRIVQEGHSVYAAIRPGGSTERLTDVLGRVSVVAADLRKENDVRELVAAARPECAIHLAWYAVPGKYWTASENLECVSMTLSLAQALSSAGCPRLVAAGSCAEYDWNYGYLSEDRTPLKPDSLYGACKNATREILESFCTHAGMQFAWARFFYLYGPGEAKERLVPSVILAMLRGQTAKCTEGEQIRDFLHVEDVASAVWALARSNLTGPVNIGSGEPVKVRTVVETLGKILRASDEIALGQCPSDPSEPPLLVADVRKLMRIADRQRKWMLEDGLRHAVSWWRRQNKNHEGACEEEAVEDFS